MAQYFSVESDLSAMLRFELALAKVSAALGIIPSEANRDIQADLAGFQPDIALLNAAVVNDGVVIPNLIAQMRSALSPSVAPYLHFGATSQDVIDSSLMLRMTQVMKLLRLRLDYIIEEIARLEQEFGAAKIMGHTRMQAALPITVADRLESWKQPLIAYRSEVESLCVRRLPLQLGGAVGTLEKFGSHALALRAALAEELGLSDHPQWHSQRGFMADLAHLLGKISGSLGKIGQDIALMAQAGIEIAMSGGGASSAMPHKQNPVAAEVLVSQARFTATLISGCYQSLVHEQERSGAAWTLEWMLLPQIAISCGSSTLCAKRLLNAIVRLG